MRIIALFFLFSFFFGGSPAEAFDHSDWNEVLARYTSGGRVDYARLAQSRKLLDQYLESASALSFETLAEFSREERIALWINVFNAAVVRLVLDSYPIERFDQIPAAWEIRIVRIGGEFFSLSEIRDQVLRKTFRDERVLTALVSGSMDSPPLFPEAFRGETLDDQLNRSAHRFVEDDTRNQIIPGKKEIALSPLFERFGQDFLLNFGRAESERFSKIESAVISFFLHHLTNPEKRIFLDTGKFRIRYAPPDPRLNDIRFAPAEESIEGAARK